MLAHRHSLHAKQEREKERERDGEKRKRFGRVIKDWIDDCPPAVLPLIQRKPFFVLSLVNERVRAKQVYHTLTIPSLSLSLPCFLSYFLRSYLLSFSSFSVHLVDAAAVFREECAAFVSLFSFTTHQTATTTTSLVYIYVYVYGQHMVEVKMYDDGS